MFGTLGSGGGRGVSAGISNPAAIDADATGEVATLRTNVRGTLTWSKLSGASTLSIAAATGVVSLSEALGEDGTASAVIRVENMAGDAAERQITLRARAGSVDPVLSASPNPASFIEGAAPGTLVATISNIPDGASLSINPNDGRLAATGNQIVVGLTASSAGTTNYTISAPGAVSVVLTVNVEAAGGTMTFTRQSSVVYRGEFFDFYDGPSVATAQPAQALVAYDPDGQPLIKPEAGMYGRWRRASDQVAATIVGGRVNLAGADTTGTFDTLFWRHGCMKDPLLTLGNAQAFDERWAYYRTGSGRTGPTGAACVPANPALNVDHGYTGQNIALDAPGSYVKAISSNNWDGVVPVQSPWVKIKDASVVHVLPVGHNPAVGAFAPGASDLDKTTYTSAALRDLSCLPGLGYTEGQPTMAALEAQGAFARGFWPYFGQNGEQRKSWMEPEFDPTANYSGNVAGYALKWAEWGAALEAEGAAALPQQTNRALSFGAQLHGLVRRGWIMEGGAGQNGGHQFFGWLFGRVFRQVPGVEATALALDGNATTQPFWVENRHVGKPEPWPGNHAYLQPSYTEAHVGHVEWAADKYAHINQTGKGGLNSVDEKDYQFTSGVGVVAEMFNGMLLRGGAGVRDGAQFLARTDSNFGPSNPHAAPIAYVDAYMRKMADSALVGNQGSVFPAWLLARWNALRDSVSAPRHNQAPLAISPVRNRTAYLWAIDGGFGWDWRTIGGVYPDEPVLEWQTRYSLDGRSWRMVASQTSNGTQTGLPNGRSLRVQYRRRSASGWSAWSVNWPQRANVAPYSTNPNAVDPRNTITTLGSPTGPVINVDPPVLVVPIHPRSPSSEFQPSPSTMDLSINTVLYLARGFWTGALQTGQFRWRRNGGLIAGASTDSYPLTLADTGQSIVGEVSMDGGTTWVASAAVAIPARPDLPAGVIIENDFSSLSFRLNYEEVFNSFVASSVYRGTSTPVPIVLDPTAQGFVGDDQDAVLEKQGVIRAQKNGLRPQLRGNLAARRPLTIGQQYQVELHIPIGIDVALQAGGQQLNIGSTPGGQDGSNNYRAELLPTDPQPREARVSFTFTALGTDLWLFLQQNGGQGTTVGGNPQLSYVRVVAA
jgi:hypothetical protein